MLLDAATMAPVENPDDLYKVCRTTDETGRAHSTLSRAALWSPTWSTSLKSETICQVVQFVKRITGSEKRMGGSTDIFSGKDSAV